MAANANYVQIPRDLNNIKQKFVLGLTKRQVLFFGIGALFGFGVFALIKDFGLSAGITGLFITMMPFAFFGMYEKNKLPFEKYLKHWFRANFLRKKLRLYKSQNIYTALEDKARFDREVRKVGYFKKSFKIKFAEAFEAADKIRTRDRTKRKN